MFILWLILIFGIPFYFCAKCDRAQKECLDSLQREMYADQSGRVVWTLTESVPLMKERHLFRPGCFRSDVFQNADQVRAYMKEHPCVQYEKLAGFMESSYCSPEIKDAFLLWMFSTSYGIRGHIHLNCVDIRTAFSMFTRYYSGTYDREKEFPFSRLLIRNIILTVIFFKLSTLYYGLSDIVIVVALLVIPVELIIALVLEKKARSELKMTASDHIITARLGGTRVDRLMGTYLGVQTARLTHQIVKKRW